MQIKKVIIVLSVVFFAQFATTLPRRGGDVKVGVEHGVEVKVLEPFVEKVNLKKRATKPQQRKGKVVGGVVPGVEGALVKRATKPQQRKGKVVGGVVPGVEGALVKRATKPQQRKGKGLGGEVGVVVPGVEGALVKRATKPQQRKGKVVGLVVPGVEGVLPVGV